MKVLMLIISSDTDRVYDDHREVWSLYMNSNPQIECYFIQYRDGPQEIEGNTFWLTGKESFEKIISKTIDSLDYFLKKSSYDFIVRTNLSSVWNFKVLLKYLESLPRQRVYNSFLGNYKNIIFAAGCGYIITPDVADLLIKNRQIAETFPELDDVAVGYTMNKIGIKLSIGRRNDSLTYDEESYHYRVKNFDNRHVEKNNMLRILNLINQT